MTAALRENVQTIVVIYAENRSFDNLFGHFPGAHGLRDVVDTNGRPTKSYIPQKDRNGTTILEELPRTWGGVTARGVEPAISEWRSARLANAPFAMESAFDDRLATTTVTRDLVHRFFQHQMQIHGGANDMFAAWSDAGGMTMGGFDYESSELSKLAHKYVLADNFFQGAFGGSFLNHQYLICACAPEYPRADTTLARWLISTLVQRPDGRYLPVLRTTSASSMSALDGPPVFANDGNITPKNYFGDGTFRAVNTMQPPYQPSGNPPSTTRAYGIDYADADSATTLPPQTQQTIGDLLDNARVRWTWYAGSWSAAVTDGKQRASAPRSVIYRGNSSGYADDAHVDFQPHHQPFNYYANFDPRRHAADRATHLKDGTDFEADATAGSLPPVAFYKPDGRYNQHAGNSSIDVGDKEIADLVRRLQASPQWPGMVIVVAYDEFGGGWDHVAPPRGDLLGPGTRIPAIIISPFAKNGIVDHTQYDTGSIIRFIRRRFSLGKLAGLVTRDDALKAAGRDTMGDLVNALRFP